MRGIVVTVALGTLLTACAQGPSPAPAAGTAAAPPPRAAAAAGSLDGVYVGASVSTRRSISQCPVPGPVRVPVRNGVISRTWNGQPIQAQVKPDGTFSEQQGRVSMSGSIRDGKLEMAFGNEYCQYSYSLTKG